MAGRTKSGAAERKTSRKNDPERTREDILEVATEEFAAHGLSGARVDAIAERTRTSKRMIYYYFGGKEGLYHAVLEKAYADIRTAEAELHLEGLPPEEAMRRLAEFTFDYDEAHPDFIRLVSIENIHRAEHLAHTASIRSTNLGIVQTIAAILERGRKDGVFRAEIDPVDLHMLISAFCFFRVSNRHTFGTIFRRDLSEPGLRETHRRMIGDAVIRLLQGQAAVAPAGAASPARAKRSAGSSGRRPA
ncbi:TetR family transcriptional regulator [Inquilinus limosus]|uniref:TetR family transcriptional regulator n=1 Tax=Inquilinus limosus TaxID=171674 RepID=A0A211ZUD2_9PROT|nr:TetR family transcriptional regulator [Inquilinus limosus]OWJ68853.1 TetR family transcriptional regulator [Inquilinus limosus]